MREVLKRPGVVLGTLAVLLGVSLAMAQQPGGRGRGFGFRGFGRGAGLNNPLQLVNNEVVQKELDLVPEQTGQLQQLPQQMFAEMQEEMQKAGVDFGRLFEMSDEERAKAEAQMRSITDELNKKYRAKLAEILLPPQMQRLKQIVWQMDLPAALQDAEVVEALALTDAQQKQIAEIVSTYETKIRELMPFPGRGGQGGPGGPGRGRGRGRPGNQGGGQDAQAGGLTPDGRTPIVLVQQGPDNQQPGGLGERFRQIREQVEQLQKERDAKLLEVLSAEQRGKWQSLIGEPVDVAAIQEAARRAFGQFGGGRGGAGGRRRGGQPDRPPQE